MPKKHLKSDKTSKHLKTTFNRENQEKSTVIRSIVNFFLLIVNSQLFFNARRNYTEINGRLKEIELKIKIS